MRRSGPLLVVGLTLCVGVGLLARGSPSQADPTSGRIAVVDIAEVIENAPGRRIATANSQAEMDKIKTYKQGQEDKLRDLDGRIIRMTKGDPERKKLFEQMARLNAETEFEVKWRVSQAEGTYADALEGLYGQIRGTIQQVAREGQYTLVLAKADERLDLKSPNEFGAQVVVRQVLYADPGFDITRLVKERLAAGSTPPPVPAGPPASGQPVRPQTPPAPPTPSPSPVPGPGAGPAPTPPLPTPVPGMR